MFTKYSNLKDLLYEVGRTDRGLTIIYNSNKESFFAYSDLYKKACQRLAGLQYNGISEDCEVIIQCQDIKEFLITFWACILGRMVAIPSTLSGNPEEKNRLMNIVSLLDNPIIITDTIECKNFGTTVFYCQNLDLDGGEDYKLPFIKEDDIAFIQFSSGSTGKPKGVVLTHKNLMTNISAIILGISMKMNDSTLNWMPLTHDMGLIGFHLTPLCAGIDQYHIPVSLFIRNPLIWMKKVSEHKVSITCSPNFGYQHFMKYAGKCNSSFTDDINCLRIIFNGAEPISYDVCNEFTEALKDSGIRNNVIFPVYGLAEASLAVTFPAINENIRYVVIDRTKTGNGKKITFVDETDRNAVKLVSVGKPVKNCYVKITDIENQECSDGSVGHILISGSNVASGYYRNENETKKAIKAGSWLCTGDLGFIYEGNLYITGREKDVIFINGANFYSHDLERILSNMPEIGPGKTVVSSFFNYLLGKDEVLVFINSRKKIEDFFNLTREVKIFLYNNAGISPEYVIPVDKIPKTTSGKVKRYELVNNFQNGDYNDIIEIIRELSNDNNSLLILSDEQKKIYNVLSNTIGGSLNYQDSFISAGGDSITMIKVINAIEQELGAKISPSDLISAPTIAELCSIIENRKDTEALAYPTITPDPNTCYTPFPLTPVQEAYLIGRNESIELGGVAAHGYYEIETTLDIDKLNRALIKVIARHDMLRAIFLPSGQQMILEHVPNYEIKKTDLRRSVQNTKVEYVLNYRTEMSHKVFDTAQWPLFAISALQLDDNSNYLFFSLDLLIADGFSIGIIIKDLLHFYHHPGEEPVKSTLSYRDYVMGLKELESSDFYKRDKEYWMGEAEGFPSCAALPLLCAPASVKNPWYNRLQEKIPHHQWSIIKEKARSHNVTSSSLLCTLYAMALSRYSNQQHLAINITIFNRYPFHEAVNSLVGDFTSVILLDVELSHDAGFWQLVEKTQGKLVAAIEHKHYDGVEFIRELSRLRGTGSSALMPVVFTSMLFGSDHFTTDALEELGEIKYGISQTSQVYLDFQASEDKEGLVIRWDYVEQLFDADLIRNIFGIFTSLLRQAGDDSPQIKLQLPSYDIHLIEKYNTTTAQYSPETLLSLFLKSVQDHPENIAVACLKNQLSYRALDQKSNTIASYLKEKGIQCGDRIGVIVHRNLATIVNILGILKTGAAYVPISPEYPRDRQHYILDNSGCGLCLDNVEIPDNVPELNPFTPNGIKPEDLAYIIYTSGSTGNPKGVCISHKAVVNTILDINQRFLVTDQDRIIGLSSMGFDLSVFDIFGALSCGATLVMVPDLKDMGSIRTIINTHEITIWNSVPAIMELLIETAYQEVFKEDNATSLRLVMLSGDWIPLNLPGKITSVFSSAEIISLGGATECSIWSIYYPVKNLDPAWKSIPYGMPLANQTMYILDNNMETSPVGVEGEIYIGGLGVAECYDNDTEKTRQAFVEHPDYGRIYKTGDYGILNRDGWIEFKGRKDGQVKIAGHRIELAEIEHQLQTFAGIKAAVVSMVKNEKGISKIAGYYISDIQIQESELRTHLKGKLPDYMIPAWLVKIEEMPLSSNGKVDRKKLPAPQGMLSKTIIELPSTETEKYLSKLWEDILETTTNSIHDNFFESGGDSIKAIRLFSKLKDKYPVQMHTVFENPTIADLANKLDSFQNQEENIFENLLKQYEKNKPNIEKLSPEVTNEYQKYLSNIGDIVHNYNFEGDNNYKTVLITGATGYLGAYLLFEFVANTNCKIFTIVRAKDNNIARERVKAKLIFYFGEITAIKIISKIFVLAGDLSEDQFGLDGNSYAFLSRHIDAIVNSAASVAHWDVYKKLYHANVQSVINIIDFAKYIKTKDVHHISSCILASGHIPGVKQAILMEDKCDIGQQIDDYYGKSKFEAEQVIERSRAEGVNISVYRMGNIAFHSNTGAFQENIHDNAFYKLMKLFFTVEKIPLIPYKILDFTYVNEAATAIRKITEVKSLLNRTFHLMNPNKIGTDELHKYLSKTYQNLELLPYVDFMNFLEKESEQNKFEQIDQVLIHTDMLLAWQQDTQIMFATEHTTEILKQLDFTWTKPREIVFKKMMDYIRQVKFIEG